MRHFYIAFFLCLLSLRGFSQTLRSENTATLVPTGCPTLYPTQAFTLCNDPTTTITPVIHTIGSAPISFSWSLPAFHNIEGSDTNMQLVTYAGGVFTLTAQNATIPAAPQMTYTVVICDDVGIEELSATTPLISIYPNPVAIDDKLNISLRSDANVLIYNSTGALLLTRSCGTGLNQFDMSAFSTGLYYVHISSNKGSGTFKVAVNK